MRIAAVLLLSLLCSNAYSFSSSLESHLHNPLYHDARANEKLPFQLASTPPRITEQDQLTLAEGPRTSSNHASLELDLEQGCIREGPRVLLNGMNPSIWSATRVAEDDDNSLFLHTRHTKESAQFETPLGDLLSCNRLLACAREYQILVPSVWCQCRVITISQRLFLIVML